MFRWLNRFTRDCARELAFRLRVWSPRLSPGLLAAVGRLTTANAPHWQATPAKNKKGCVLVEGQLSQYGPNYAFRTGLAARALQEELGLDIEVLFSGHSYQWNVARSIYRSFGISRWIYLATAFPVRRMFYWLLSEVVATWLWSRLTSPADLVEVSLGGVRFGDLVYDDILKKGPERTIDRLNLRVRSALANGTWLLFQYRALFSRREYSYLISSHTQYSEFGLLCRAALSARVKVIETTDIQMSLFSHMTKSDLPTYHNGIRNRVGDSLQDPRVDRDALRSEGLRGLSARTSVHVDQLDVKKAYSGRLYTRESLGAALGLRASSHVAFVAAHVCCDAPHCGSTMLFADYYQWLVATIAIARRAPGTEWIVKPHPSSALYGEGDLVQTLVSSAGAANVHMCPSDLNVESIRHCADAVVTAYGTIGLESSCFGVPALIAGRPFYSSFGFTMEPASVLEYEKAMLSLASTPRLSAAQVDRALEVYALWNEQFDFNNPIITTAVLERVWGSDRLRDLEGAFQLMAANLQANDPRKLKLWDFVRGVARRERASAPERSSPSFRP